MHPSTVSWSSLRRRDNSCSRSANRPMPACSSSSVRALRSDSATSARTCSASSRYSSLCGVPNVTCRAEDRTLGGSFSRICDSRSSSGPCAAVRRPVRPAGCRSAPGAAAVGRTGRLPAAERSAAACATRAVPARPGARGVPQGGAEALTGRRRGRHGWRRRRGGRGVPGPCLWGGEVACHGRYPGFLLGIGGVGHGCRRAGAGRLPGCLLGASRGHTRTSPPSGGALRVPAPRHTALRPDTVLSRRGPGFGFGFGHCGHCGHVDRRAAPRIRSCHCPPGPCSTAAPKRPRRS